VQTCHTEFHQSRPCSFGAVPCGQQDMDKLTGTLRFVWTHSVIVWKG